MTNERPYSWLNLVGPFTQSADSVTFRGDEYEPAAPPPPRDASDSSVKVADVTAPPPPKRALVGQTLTNQRYTEGKISVEVEFAHVDYRTFADIMIQYDPANEEMINVGLGGAGGMFALRMWTSQPESLDAQSHAPKVEPRQSWNNLRAGGERKNLVANRPYHLEFTLRGSTASFVIDGVEAIRYNVPFQLPGRQVGLFCANSADITFRNFRVEARRPQAFVVMQFTPEYDDLYTDVITPVCRQLGLEPYRADQTYTPGLIISDITKRIAESRVVIADITPVNGNVYYEVGYADALGKPVILIADRQIKELPFDVRPYRTIFYENTIGGKSRVQSTLEKFIQGIMADRSI